MSEEIPAETETDETDDIVRTLGIERWVQFSFVIFAFIVFYVGDKLIFLVWNQIAEPMPNAITAIAAGLGIGAGALLYANPKINTQANEVASELALCTWPTRQETWSSTVVVIVTSAIAALYLGLFDMAWSQVTDLLYSTT